MLANPPSSTPSFHIPVILIKSENLPFSASISFFSISTFLCLAKIPPPPNMASPPSPSTDPFYEPPLPADVDASLDNDIDMSNDAKDGETNGDNKDDGMADAEAARPTLAKKDISLREFLGKMDDYAPIVCPTFLQHILFR